MCIRDSAINKPNIVGEVDSQKILNGKLRSNEQIELGVYSTVEQSSTSDDYNSERKGQTSQKSTPFISKALNAPDFLNTDSIEENGEGSRISLAKITDNSIKQFRENTPIEVYRPVEAIKEVEISAMSAKSDPIPKSKPRFRPRLAPELTTGPCLLYTSPSPRDATLSRMPSSA